MAGDALVTRSGRTGQVYAIDHDGLIVVQWDSDDEFRYRYKPAALCASLDLTRALSEMRK